MEFLVVQFEDDCGVIINGASGDWMTNERLRLQAGSYLVTLDLPAGDFEPPERKIRLANTAPNKPRRIAFTKVG